MDDTKVLSKFIQQSPFAVLTQAVMRALVGNDDDTLFQEK